MKSNKNTIKELILEVQKDGHRRLVFRTDIGNKTMLFLEESDLVDFSRPLTENGDFNVFFTKRAFWKSFTEFTSNEGLLKRQVWHEENDEWLNLRPIFIHEDIRHLVQSSLADVTRDIDPNDSTKIDGIRNWLRRLSESTSDLNQSINPSRTYRHAV
jgi:hypothetical protein